MSNYFTQLKLLFSRLMLVVFFFSLCRLGFYLHNQQFFSFSDLLECLYLFAAGIRFDLSAILYFNLLFVVLSLVPGKVQQRKGYQRLLKAIFVVVNFLIIGFNIVDFKFFEFESRRMTSDIFSPEFFSTDVGTILPQFLHDFWYLFLYAFFVLAALVKFYPKSCFNLNILKGRGFYWKSAACSVIVLAFVLFAARGGWQLKPLRVSHAARYTGAQNIPLVTNSAFTILKTIGKKKEKVLRFYSDEKLNSIYSPVKRMKNGEMNRKNVVLFIMESFSKEYIGKLSGKKSYTPFLDELIDKSMVFDHFYSNGKRSIESMPSILSSLPHLFKNAYIASPFSTNKIHSLAGELNKAGYETSIFHGGRNGTMGFDQFSSIAGFQQYVGLNEYGSKEGFDGKWGIFDHVFLPYFLQRTTAFQQPFFSCFYSLSSHHPYTIPEEFKGKFPKGELPIHESIGYADEALRRYFEQAGKEEWFNNTVFVITADHTAQAVSAESNTRVGMYEIPLIVYAPGDSTMIGRNATVSQQADIFPSILDYLNYSGEFISYGNSVFDAEMPHYAISYINGIYQLLIGEYAIWHSGEKVTAVYRPQEDPMLKTNLAGKVDLRAEEELFQAIIQSFQSRVAANNTCLENELVARQ
ncbi:MAG: sulfatase-like hydrolase/transferase [Cytophagales bacterium]|nr:sulfatase-like hydrolase/transferase [Cytophagales bacterium]